MEATERIIDYILERLHLLENMNDDLTAENDYQRKTIDQLETIIKHLNPHMCTSSDGSRNFINFESVWDNDIDFETIKETFINKEVS